MPLWAYALQVILMLACVYGVFAGVAMSWLSAAFSGVTWEAGVCLLVSFGLLVLLIFLIYHPTTVWDLLRLIPLPPNVKVS